MNQPADMFGAALADIATGISRQALQSDPQLLARLGSLQGNTVELQCTLPPGTWHVSIDAEGLSVQSGPAVAPQAVVRGTLTSLIAWLLPGGNTSGLEVSGDNTLLLELADMLKGFSPDLAVPLSDLLGAELANSLVGGAEAGIQALQSLLAGAGRGVQTQAGRQFVQQSQLDAFLDGVDALRLRVDRLDARIREVERMQPSASRTSSNHGR
jgi:ubiquinone biosynthesis protein UbiJ